VKRKYDLRRVRGAYQTVIGAYQTVIGTYQTAWFHAIYGERRSELGNTYSKFWPHTRNFI